MVVQHLINRKEYVKASSNRDGLYIKELHYYECTKKTYVGLLNGTTKIDRITCKKCLKKINSE